MIEKKKLIIFMNDCLLETEGSSLLLLTIPHPRNGEKTIYVNGNDDRIFEILAQNKGVQSWFIDNYVEEDGSLYVTSEVDPLFLLLPHFMKNNKFIPLEDLDFDDEFPHLRKLTSNKIVHKSIELVADVKHVGDENVCRYNETKTLMWCEKKAKKVAKLLQKRKLNVCSGSTASTFKSSDEKCTFDEDYYLPYAVGIVSEYLPNQLSELLHKILGLSQESKTFIQEPDAKRKKLCKVDPEDDYSVESLCKESTGKNGNLTSNQKKLKKVDRSGMKTMESFFKKSSNKN